MGGVFGQIFFFSNFSDNMPYIAPIRYAMGVMGMLKFCKPLFPLPTPPQVTKYGKIGKNSAFFDYKLLVLAYFQCGFRGQKNQKIDFLGIVLEGLRGYVLDPGVLIWHIYLISLLQPVILA